MLEVKVSGGRILELPGAEWRRECSSASVIRNFQKMKILGAGY